MRVMIIIWLILFSIIITAKVEKLKNHECDTIIVTMPVIDTVSEYICMDEHGSHYCGFDPVKAALMLQAD